MPSPIRPKKIQSLNPGVVTISPYGAWRYQAQIGGPLKRRGPRQSALSKFFRGYTPGIQNVMENNKESKLKLHESINELIRSGASKHVNKYMKSPDGKKLRQQVTELIRTKLGTKNI
jgi:hypothetical protein